MSPYLYVQELYKGWCNDTGRTPSKEEGAVFFEGFLAAWEMYIDNEEALKTGNF